MSRTAFTVGVVPAFGGGLANVGMAAVDQANGNSIPGNDGKVKLIVTKTGGGSVVVTVAAPAGPRTANTALTKTMTVASGNIGEMGPFDPGIFNQSDGSVNVDYDTGTNVTAAATRTTPTPAG